MKKYIFAAVIALLGFSSCRLSDGGIRDYNKVPRMIFNKVQYATCNYIPKQIDYVILAEVLMQSDNVLLGTLTAQYMETYGSITVEENKYLFHKSQYGESNSEICVQTDGKLLSEGGEWIIGRGKDKIVFEIARIKGKDGTPGRFEFSTGGDIPEDMTPNTEALRYDVEYELVKEASNYRIDKQMAFEGWVLYNSTDEYNYWKGKGQYKIEWHTVKPIVMKGEDLCSYGFDLLYTNLDDGTTHHVGAFLYNGEIFYERYFE